MDGRRRLLDEIPVTPLAHEVVGPRVRKVDVEDLTEIFDRHWPAIRAFSTSRAGAAGEDIAAEAFRIAFDGLSNAMRAENRHGALRHFIEFLDEARAFLAQIVDHVTIVDNLVTYIHGRAVLL